MTVRLPDPRISRAVLIGTSAYDSPDFKPLLAVRNNLEVLQELLTSDSGAFMPGRCTVVQDSSDPRGVCRTIREAAREASDTLLVYFSGHGILSDDLTHLHLALTCTDQSDLRWTTVPFQAIREIFETAACRNKILILDCCQSGWILDAMMGGNDHDGVPLDIRGTYLLTSSSAELKSYAPPGDRYTAFTGELVRLLRDGLPGGPELLPLSVLFEPLSSALERRRLPSPRQQGSDDHAALALVRNRAAPQGRLPATGGPRQHTAERDTGRVPETQLSLNASYLLRQLAGLLLAGAAVWGIAKSLPGGGGSLISVHGVLVALFGALFLPATWLGRSAPNDYSLVIGQHGIEVRYEDQHFYYPWHRVSRVWVAARYRGRFLGTSYTLLLRPKPGVLPKTAKRGAPGPRRDKATGALRIANLRHLNQSPAAVEKMLSQAAGSAWTPSNGQLGPAPDDQSEATFSTDRAALAGVALLAAFLAYGALSMAFSPLFGAAAFAAGLACLALSRVVHPVRLVVSAAGVSLARARTRTTYAWSEIEHIGILPWQRGPRNLPGLPHCDLLVLRPVARPDFTPVGRTAFYLPKLDNGCVTLCMLPEVTGNTHRLRAALNRFADTSQAVPPAHGWLRPLAPKATRTTKAPKDGTTVSGLRPTRASVALFGVSTAPLIAMLLWYNAGSLPPPIAALSALLLPFLPYAVLAAYFLTGRHRIELHVGTSGLTLTVCGLRPQSLRVPWGDIESVGIVHAQRPTAQHSLMMWLRPGAKPPRSLWWFYRQEHGGLRLMSLEGSRLNTTPEDLDRAIARHAGHRHTNMDRLSHRQQDAADR
ncbi:caspase family protein [Streptomyces sp. NPDC051976]|uniref:caspase family protein n=1 Tax=Streptomyces sp. NPDC051976 TaxID=3154947 RepID=UPI00342F706D